MRRSPLFATTDERRIHADGDRCCRRSCRRVCGCSSKLLADPQRMAAQCVKVVGVKLLGEVGLLTTVHDLEILAPKVAFERLAQSSSFADDSSNDSNWDSGGGSSDHLFL